MARLAFSRQDMDIFLKSISIIGLAFLGGYLLLLGAIWAGQEAIIFQREELPLDYQFSFSGAFREVQLPAADGTGLHGLHFMARQPARGAVLYFHGNRGSLSRWGAEHTVFTSRGYDVLMPDYRGYGKSGGRPSEWALYQDAAEWLSWLKGRYPADSITIYGRSLGTGPASWLAAQDRCRSLILETPFDEMPHVFESQVFLPLPKGVFRHRFPNAEWLPTARCPVYIIAGSRDKLTPLYLARRLQPLLRAPSDFFLIEGGGHRNLPQFAEYQLVLDALF